MEQYTGYKRSLTISVTKKINGITENGYPKTYPTSADTANGYFTYDSTQYTIPDDYTLARMSNVDYNNLANVLELYVAENEGTVNYLNNNVDLDEETCSGATPTTTVEPTTTSEPTTTAEPAIQLSGMLIGGYGDNTLASTNDDGLSVVGLGSTPFDGDIERLIEIGSRIYGIGFDTGYSTVYKKYSEDGGITWNDVPTTNIASDAFVFDIIYNGSTYVIATDDATNKILYSNDGLNWTPATNSAITSPVHSLLWDGSKFIAGAFNDGTNNLAYSSDGITWTGLGYSTEIYSIEDITVNGTGDLYIAVGSGSGGALNTVLYSNDGLTWSGATKPSALANGGQRVVYYNNTFVATGLDSSNRFTIATSSNGVAWTTRVTGTATYYIYALKEYDSKLFAISTNRRIYKSTDATTWAYESYYGILQAYDLVGGEFTIPAEKDSFSLTYSTVSLTDSPYWFFELEPDYYVYSGLTMLRATAYDGDNYIFPPDYPDDYYGGISIYGDEQPDIPTGVTNTLKISSDTFGFPEATWLMFIHNMIVNGDLDVSRFTSMSSFEMYQANLTSLTLPNTMNKDWNVDWDFWKISGLTSFDLSGVVVQTTALGIKVDLNYSECEQSSFTFFSGGNGDGTIACDAVYFNDNPNLTTITFPDTPIFDDSSWFYFSNNPSLTTINMSGNTSAIKNFRFQGNTAYGYFDTTIFPNLTNVSSSYYYFDNNNWSVTDVNRVLVDLDNNSVGGYTTRRIYINGTNAAPDGTSGGYDGLTAKANLEAKGFTVFVTA